MGISRLAQVTVAAAGAVTLIAMPAPAATPAEQQKRFEAEARAAAPSFGGFSAQRGEAFFKATHGAEWSCASCHTGNPLAAGKHAKTGKPIAPLAPAANAVRFTDAATVDKWFRRNCNDVLGRACTAQEKGDVLQYLMSVK
jgi:mono/diheme cytochrome c family protein